MPKLLQIERSMESFIKDNVWLGPICFNYGKPSHLAKDRRSGGSSAMLQGQGIKGGLAQGGSQCTNQFYVLHSRKEVKETLDIVTGILKVFHFNACALLDLGVNLSFVTPFFVNRFDASPKVLLDPFDLFFYWRVDYF